MVGSYRQNKKGLTLIEMTISALILGLVMGAMLGAFVIARVSAAKSKHRIEAMNLLRAKMEELKDSGYDDIVNEGGVDISMDIGPDLEEDTDDDLRGERSVDVEDQDGFKIVTVRLRWDERAWGGATREVSLALVTLISEALHQRED